MSTLFERGNDEHYERERQQKDAAVKMLFGKLKASCVPLLGLASLTSQNVPRVLGLLESLHATLVAARTAQTPLTPPLVQYTFFPLSNILRRNDVGAIPDQVLERLFLNMGLLCDQWWWTCETQIWEQLLLLAGSILLPPTKPGSKVRDEHTKEAACECIWQLVRRRTPEEQEAATYMAPLADADLRFHVFQEFGVTRKLFPVLGQLVSNLLVTCASPHKPLQMLSFQLCELFITDYLGRPYAPTILPGVVSAMCKILTSRGPSTTTWPNSEVCAAALRVLKAIVVQSVCDEACVADGVIQARLQDIADLNLASFEQGVVEPLKASSIDDAYAPPTVVYPPFIRTPSWLAATASQLHIALNTLTPLLLHPSPSVQLAFSQTCSRILTETMETLVPTQPLLLSNLLTLSVSQYPTVSLPTRAALADSLTLPLIETMMQMTQSSLTNLPRVIPGHSDTKVQHLAQQIEAVCLLSIEHTSTSSIANAIGSLLGPSGGIEKWGHSLLNVLEFSMPMVAPVPVDHLLEISAADFASSATPAFARLELKQLQSHEALDALERMLRALGKVAGEACLYSVEWFVERGRSGTGPQNVAAFWLACRLLEGVGGADATNSSILLPQTSHRAKALAKRCRWIVRSLSELLTEPIDAYPDGAPSSQLADSDEIVAVDYRRGVNQLTTLLDTNIRGKSSSAWRASKEAQKEMHTIMSLHMMAIASSILGLKFRPLLLHALYALIHALVSPSQLVSSTAHVTLLAVTNATAYASPANLFLANFDYALNSASLHLTRYNLDVQATKVLVMLVRLVGGDVVERAGDVVEECFDRLDEYHGYGVVVEGLVDVLGEVVRVIRTDDEANAPEGFDPSDPKGVEAARKAALLETRGPQRFEDFMSWFEHLHDPDPLDGIDEGYIGPVPQHAWGDKAEAEDQEEATPRDEDLEQEPKPTPPTQVQALTEQIVSRSLFFLTHPSPLIRARILALLSSAVPVLRTIESSLLPSVNTAWPFIVNRLGDSEPFVVTEAAALIEALVTNVGDFMGRRIWDDVWPRFKTMLKRLEEADAQSALARTRGATIGVGTRTAYSVSHRMYRSLLGTLTAVIRGTELRDVLAWEVALACRRFLSANAHAELQKQAKALYLALAVANSDMIWLVLSASIAGERDAGANSESPALGLPAYLRIPHLNIVENAVSILDTL